MSSSRRLLSAALHRGATLRRAQSRARTVYPKLLPSHATRFYASLNPKPEDDTSAKPDTSRPTEHASPEHTASEKMKQESFQQESSEQHEEKPGAIGGFMRGLIGGQPVAVEDAFIAEAKEQGVELPPPPPPRNADLVPVKRRKRKEDDDAESQTIRDRIFGRFGGSSFMQGAFNAKERIAERIDESDNPVVNMFRNLYDRFFAENEMATVVREIREEDPEFKVSEFLQEVEEKFVPNILGAYLQGDRDALKSHCTEEAFAMLNASIRERDAEKIVMDTNILDISEVEMTAGKVLEDSPVLIVSFNTQQINCLRDRAGTVIEGQEDDIRAVYYAWAFVKEAEYEDFSPSGGGMGANAKADGEGHENKEDKEDKEDKEEESDKRPWKLMEMVIRGAHSTI